jgi:hypothetical protein
VCNAAVFLHRTIPLKLDVAAAATAAAATSAGYNINNFDLPYLFDRHVQSPVGHNIKEL